MIKNREIQSPIGSSLEARLREMKMDDTVEVTVSLLKPYDTSLQLLSFYLSGIGISDYCSLPSFGLVVDLDLTRREIIDVAEQEYVRDICLVRDEYG